MMGIVRRPGFFAILLLLAGLVAGGAAAQTIPRPDPDEFPWDGNALRRLEDDGRRSANASPLNTDRELVPFIGEALDENMHSQRWTDPNMWCPDSDPYCVTEQSDVIKWQPGRRKSSIHSFAPMTGFVDVANSLAYADMSMNLLTSPSSLMMTAMGLTEPGVAQGHHSAMMQAGQQVVLRYQADQAFYNAANANPESRDIIINTYHDCINLKLRGLAMNGRDPDPRGRLTWVQAQSECLGGEVSIRTYNAGTVQAFAQTDQPQGMQMGYNRNHRGQFENMPLNQGSDPFTETGDITSISMLDYLFNQEWRNERWQRADDPTFGNDSSMHLRSIGELRSAFAEMIGDIHFRLKPGTTAAGPAGSTRDFEIEKIPPLAGRRPEDYYRELVKQSYTDVMNIMYLRCTYVPTDLGNYVALGSPIGQDFYRGGGPVGERLRWLGMKGYKAKPSTIEGLYSFFVASQEDLNEPDCDLLMSWIQDRATSIESIFGGTGQQSEVANNLNTMIRVIFFYGQRLAMGQFLSTFIKAEDFVKSTTGGAYDTMIKKYALEAIYTAAGTSNLKEAYESNLRQLTQFIERLEPYVANKRGLNLAPNTDTGGSTGIKSN